MKAKILTDLFERVVVHKNRVISVENNETDNNLTASIKSDMYIKVRSKKDKDVTELLTELAEFKKYEVSTEMIKKDINTSYYESTIKVGLDDSK